MSMREREGLIARVKQIRRAGVSKPGTPTQTETDSTAALEARVTHLEELVEGLQDSVHREMRRQDRRLTELEARIEPAALAVALSKDARERGLT